MVNHFPNIGSLSDIDEPGGFFLLAACESLLETPRRYNKQQNIIRCEADNT